MKQQTAYLDFKVQLPGDYTVTGKPIDIQVFYETFGKGNVTNVQIKGYWYDVMSLRRGMEECTSLMQFLMDACYNNAHSYWEDIRIIGEEASEQDKQEEYRSHEYTKAFNEQFPMPVWDDYLNTTRKS